MKRPKSYISMDELGTLQKYLLECIHLEGDMAEVGIAHGGTSRRMIIYAKETGYKKTLHMFDSFGAMPSLSTPEETEAQIKIRGTAFNFEGFEDTEESIRAVFDAYDLTDYEIHKGLTSDTLPKFDKKLCFVHGDVDLYEPMKDVGRMATRLLVSGGYYLAHDYNDPTWVGATRATDELLEEGNFELVEIRKSKHGQCVMRRK